MRRLCVVAAIVLMSSCWQQRQRETLDLGEQTAEVAATLESLRRLDASVDGELAHLEQLIDGFFATPADFWAPPFPLDAYKHTAMSCLNAPFDENEPEPQVREAADRLGLRCAVAPAVDLEGKLGGVAQRGEAVRKLGEIDQVRKERFALQTRLRQLPSVLRRTQSFVSSRRAEARQMTIEVRAREGEYARRSFNESLREIERYEAQLVELENAVTALEDGAGRWSKELAEIVERLYMDLSRLGPRE